MNSSIHCYHCGAPIATNRGRPAEPDLIRYDCAECGKTFHQAAPTGAGITPRALPLLSSPLPPVCLHALGQPLVNLLHAEGRKVLGQRDELLRACKATSVFLQCHINRPSDPDKSAKLLEVERLLATIVRNTTEAQPSVRRKPIGWQVISNGTLDTLLVHPREVFKWALLMNAAAIVIAHNHPSGDPSPSEADIKVTRDLIRAGQLMKIDVLDHVILGDQRPGSDSPMTARGWCSLRELGYFYS